MPEFTSHAKAEKPSNSKVQNSQTPDAAAPQFSAAVGDHAHAMTSAQVLYLQRTAGNQAVARLLGRQPSRQAPMIQAKLTVGPVGDRYEQEADRIAAQVVSSPTPVQRHEDEEEGSGEQLQRSPVASQITPLVQRHHAIRGNKAPEGGEQEEEEDLQALGGIQRSPLPSVQRHYPSGLTADSHRAKKPDEHVDEKMLQRKAHDGAGFDPGHNFTQQLNANRGRGRPLGDSVRKNMESRFGASFGQVRVHTGAQAVQMSRDIQAEAFTHGSDIYFNQGRFNPSDRPGRHLLAHELTHVVQQTGAGVQRTPEVGIQRKWRSPKQWWKDRKTKKAQDKANLETVDYDSLRGLKRGQVLPEVGKMAERRMKDMMKYDKIVETEDSVRLQISNALRMIDDDDFMQGVIDAVNEAYKDNTDGAPKAAATHVPEVRAAIKTGLAGHEAETVDLVDYFMPMIKAIVKDDHYKPKTRILNEFIKQVKEFCAQRAKLSPVGKRPEGKYEGLPGMSQTETFLAERQNVQFQQVTVSPEDAQKWSAALRTMDAVKALVDPKTAPAVDQEVGWRGGGKLGDKFSYIKDNKKRGAIGPLQTYLDNKNANDKKVFARFAKVDELMRRIVEPEMLARVPVPHFKIHTRGAQSFTNPLGLRASAAAGNVNIAYNEDVPTIAHEVGHIVEEYLPMDDWADIHMLLSERHKAAGGGTRAAKGESIFTRGEGRYKGKYTTGKYTSRGYTKDNAEVLSMWMQFMAKPSDAIKLINGDPQHAALILRMMRPTDYAMTSALRPFDIYLPNPTGDDGPLAKYQQAQQKVQALFK